MNEQIPERLTFFQWDEKEDPPGWLQITCVVGIGKDQIKQKVVRLSPREQWQFLETYCYQFVGMPFSRVIDLLAQWGEPNCIYPSDECPSCGTESTRHKEGCLCVKAYLLRAPQRHKEDAGGM